MRKKKIDDAKLLAMISEGKQGIECAAFFGVSPAAISKRLKRLQPPPMPQSLEALTPKEQRFCIEVANGKTQTQAAMNSFECGSMQSAKVIGSQLMNKHEIEMAIHDLMAEAGLTKRYRLQRLRQHVDSHSADVSLKALDQSWKLDGSYAPEKHINLDIDHEAIMAELRDIEKKKAEIAKKLAEFDAQYPEEAKEGFWASCASEEGSGEK